MTDASQHIFSALVTIFLNSMAAIPQAMIHYLKNKNHYHIGKWQYAVQLAGIELASFAGCGIATAIFYQLYHPNRPVFIDNLAGIISNNFAAIYVALLGLTILIYFLTTKARFFLALYLMALTQGFFVWAKLGMESMKL